MPDAPAGENKGRPEFIMGTRQTANLWQSNLYGIQWVELSVRSG